VIVNDFNTRRADVAFLPFEAYPPLVINPYAELPAPISLQNLKTVARQHSQIANRDRRLQAIQFQAGRPFDAGERLHSTTQREVSSPLIAVAEDHISSVRIIMRYVKRIESQQLPRS